ncbi:MAG: hypothetical protein M1816_006589 [Peltula sp. TS41687]|nr:MAG: hypothetical protein M1816_006589 [Peltula sp. TS41687]
MFPFFKPGQKRRNEDIPVSDGREPKRQASSGSFIEDHNSTSDGYGIKILTQPASDKLPVVDILFVHGLTGHRERTWIYKNGNTEIFWPKDLLPSDVPQARIMVFGYDADVVHFWGRTSQSRIANHANNLLSAMAGCRRGVDVALAASQYSADAHIQQIMLATYAIAFLGTPHFGANLAKWADMLSQLIPPPKTANRNIIETLKPHSEVLADIQTGFHAMLRKETETGKRCIKIVCFHEELPSHTGSLIVEMHSAILPGYESIGIHADHKNMTKYRDRFASGYQSVLQPLLRWMEILTDKPSEEQKECLQSLSYYEMDFRKQAVEDPHESTFRWIWDNLTDFKKWLGCGSGFFWIQGKPGSGKSTLMKYILRKLRSHSTSRIPVIASYFFNNRGSSLAKSAEVEEFKRRKQATRGSAEVHWDLDSLRNMFLVTFTRWSSSKEVVLLIDGLDECEGLPEGYLSILQNIVDGCRSGSRRIKVCISSRPEPILKSTFKNTPGLCLENYTYQDILKYVDSRIEALKSLEEGSELIAKLRTDILEKANGVFLWVRFAMDELHRGLAEGDNIMELRQRLSLIPNDLLRLYEHVLNVIREHHRKQALVMLRIVLCARRPLTPFEFYYAVVFGAEPAFPSQKAMQESEIHVRDEDGIEKRIRSRCRGLLEVINSEDAYREKRRIVQFMHQSVKEFVMSDRVFELLDPGSGPSQIARGHDYLARSCIQYLCISELENMPPELLEYEAIYPLYVSIYTGRNGAQRFMFINYSVHNCMEHCQAAEELGVPQSQQIMRFSESFKQNFHVWRRIKFSIGGSDDVLSMPLAVAANFNIASFVEGKLASGDLDLDMNYALLAASCKRHWKIARLLLEHGADINAHFGLYYTPLYVAVVWGDEHTARWLLEQGADVNAQGENELNGTPLLEAAASGAKHIVRLLLEHGADVNALAGKHGTVLQAVSEEGHLEIVQLLLEHGADVNAQGDVYGTALKAAAYGNHEEVVRLLLEHGADVNAQGDGYPGTALMLAAYENHEEVVRLLLEHGADVDAQAGVHGTALHAASSPGHLEIVQLLLEHGADVNAQTRYCGTALCAASDQKHEKIVRLLLQWGAKETPR